MVLSVPQHNDSHINGSGALAHRRMSVTSLYMCNNSEIISVLGRCNGAADCLDGSDEIGCDDTTGKLKFKL